jgi:GT2 family glycosyltransferase
VVSYGETRQLRALVRALAAVPGCRVVLVENRPGVEHPWAPAGVRVLCGHGNVGFGAGVNRAVAVAGGDDAWLVVANSDVAVPAGTADALPGLLARCAGDAVAFPVRTSAGEPARSAAVLPTVRTTAFTAVCGEPAACARWPHLLYPPGAFFAVRLPVFRRLGGFDPRFFLYWEDTYLFDLLYSKRHRLVWAPAEYPVVHDGAGTTGADPWLHVEFGRSAALYGRIRRDGAGRAWPAVYAAATAALAVRKALALRPRCAGRAALILIGLAAGAVWPAWEPASSPWGAAPARERVRQGTLPGSEAPAPTRRRRLAARAAWKTGGGLFEPAGR